MDTHTLAVLVSRIDKKRETIMKDFLLKKAKQHGPAYGLLTVFLSVAAFLFALAVLTIIVRFVMS